MACSRFVYFPKGTQPNRAELMLVLEDYFNGAASEIKWSEDRFFVTLVGNDSNPFKRLPDAPDRCKLPPEPGFEHRWIEVWLGDDCVDVMTRQQDEFTNGVAECLAELIGRYRGGRVE